MSVAVDLFLEWAQCSSIDSTQLNPSLRPASVQQWYHLLQSAVTVLLSSWTNLRVTDSSINCFTCPEQTLPIQRGVWHIYAGVWGCGRPRAAPAKSHAEQRTERRFISTLLQLNNLSERHLGRVTMQVNPFPDCLPILLSLSGFTF